MESYFGAFENIAFSCSLHSATLQHHCSSSVPAFELPSIVKQVGVGLRWLAPVYATRPKQRLYRVLPGMSGLSDCQSSAKPVLHSTSVLVRRVTCRRTKLFASSIRTHEMYLQPPGEWSSQLMPM